MVLVSATVSACAGGRSQCKAHQDEFRHELTPNAVVVPWRTGYPEQEWLADRPGGRLVDPFGLQMVRIVLRIILVRKRE